MWPEPVTSQENTESRQKEKGNKQMFMYAYLGMSALVAGYFVVMYKIFY